MHHGYRLRPSRFGGATELLFGLAALISAMTATALAQSSGDAAASASAQTSSANALESWRKGMTRAPLPHQGCFTSSYPNTQWQEVPCTKAPSVPFPPARGARPSTVGDGNDVVTQVATGHILTAVGSFDSASGVTSITSEIGSDDYSLQMNVNTFSSPVCSGAGTPGSCVGWQQFIFSNGQCGDVGNPIACAFMQYWLIGWGSTTCPAGWNFFLNGSDDECYTNSDSVIPPVQPLSSFGNLSVVGEAFSGGSDTVIFSSGNALYAVQNSDSQLGLAQSGWNAVEYNVVGDCCGSAADFNAGSSVTVRVSVDNGTLTAPTCASSFSGYTAETNNLNFATPSSAHRGTSPAIVFTESSSGNAASACSAATDLVSGVLTDTHDFNADGASDILWRNSGSGQLALWLMSGGQMSSGAGLSSVPSVWSVVGTRDFNGDGNPAILWHDTSGDLAIWFMHGASIASSSSLGNVGTQWSVAGTGDFNGDGVDDILWRNTSTGDVAVWLMSDGALSSGVDLGVVPLAWQVVGTGYFKGTGTSDILWRNTSTGDLAIWFLQNGQFSSGADLGVVPLTWTVVGTGDFNGNGVSDILWRDTSGDLAIWLMNSSGQMASGATFTGIPTTWSVAETGDFNSDGKSDILWLDQSGDLGVWLMNGTAVSSPIGLGSIGTSWTVQGANAD